MTTLYFLIPRTKFFGFELYFWFQSNQYEEKKSRCGIVLCIVMSFIESELIRAKMLKLISLRSMPKIKICNEIGKVSVFTISMAHGSIRLRPNEGGFHVICKMWYILKYLVIRIIHGPGYTTQV